MKETNMRLLFFTHDSHLTGGAQKCLYELIKGLKKNNPSYQIYMLFPGKGNMIDLCLPYLNGYAIIEGNWWLINKEGKQKSKLSFLRKNIRKTYRIAQYCQKIKPNFGITNTIVDPSLATACKLLNIPHIWFIHEIPEVWSDFRFVFKTQTTHKLVNFLSHKILIPSEFTKKYYLNHLPLRKLKVINQSVEIKQIHTAPSATNHENQYTLLLIGTFDSNKGQLELLQAIKKLRDKGLRVQCFLVGNDSGTMGKCKCYITKNKMESTVKIIPYTTNIEHYYHLANVVIVCSKLETFGRVSIEAQKIGIPVILSNTGANPERIQDQVNGLLYEQGNFNDLANKIEKLSNPETRRNFADRIDPNIRNQYNIDSFSQEFKKLLHII